MRVDGPWRRAPATEMVCALLTDVGHRALFVGGAVRNALLGRAVADVDIATDALPHRVIDLAEAAGLRAIPTGLEHGTVTVVADGAPYEITTFRRDVETDGRHAVVAFTDEIGADAARRDFTMNALYAEPDGTVLDPVGGLDDLAARRVRFVGDPATRIAEDALRILRLFRFHAWYGDAARGLDPAGLAAVEAAHRSVAGLSRERIGGEMRKLLAAPDPAPSVAAMAATGVLEAALPGTDPAALGRLVALEDGRAPAWLRRLATLGAADARDALRLSRAEAQALAERTGAVGTAAALGHALGPEAATDAVLARAARDATPLPENWRAEIARGASATFPVAASDLMPALQGAALGAALADLRARWVASGFTLARDDLLA